METEGYPLELVALLKATLTTGRKEVQVGVKRTNRRNGMRNPKSASCGLGREYGRGKWSVGERLGKREDDRFVFASPKFQLREERRLKVFDDFEDVDPDSATIVSVSDSFNPYTSLESGSFSSPSHSSNDSNVDEVVNMVGNMHVLESTSSMPYIS